MEKIMANERLTESIVRDAFKADALFKSIKWEEQKSNNKRIAELLKNSSKNIDKTTISKRIEAGFQSLLFLFLQIQII